MEQAFEIDRRQWLVQAFMLAGVALTPGIEAAGWAATKGKGVLTKAQLSLLTAVADAILPATDTPGAAGVGVPAKLNGMLGTWASADTRRAIIEALTRIDAAAKTAKKKGFVALGKADRTAVLAAHDAAALKKVPQPAGAPKGHPFSPTVYVTDNGYLKLKGLVMALYYSSEAAMTRELIFDPVPGTWQPSIKADSQTRPWATTGPF